MPLDQRSLRAFAGQANGHDEVREGDGMLQAYDGYIVVLGIRIFLILGMHMYVLVGNVQCGICAAQIIRFLDAVGFRFYIELAQAHVFAVKRERERE